jgi:hypothetical protein
MAQSRRDHLGRLLRSFGTSDITAMGTQGYSVVSIPLLLIGASLSAWGQPASENVSTANLAMPEWLAPFPQARDQSVTAVPTEGASVYTALARPADVISHYEQQMRAAGVAFKTQGDGIGVSIVASAERLSAVIRIREAEDGSKVKVSYSLAPDKHAALLPANPQPANPPAANPWPQTPAPRQSSPISSGRRAPLSPFARTPYTWIMQSVIVRGSNPRKYTASYYEAPTDRTAEAPLALPAGASIIDVFPTDCMFSLQDQAGHSFTFKKAEEAMGRALAPGTWSLYPMKCSGIDIFLR